MALKKASEVLREMQVTNGPSRRRVGIWRSPAALVGGAAIEHKPQVVILFGDAEDPDGRKSAAAKYDKSKVPETTNQVKHSPPIIL